MPRNLYPSHTGRCGGLNRQLMKIRHRLDNRGDGGRYGSRYNLQKMPEGVGGDEWHPAPYQTSEMWADVEQRLHEILRNPPKVHRDPQTEAEKQENYEAQFASNPQLIQERMRGETLKEIAGGKAGDAVSKRDEKAFTNAMSMVKAKETTLYNMQKANAAHANTFSENDMDAALEALNGARRTAHKLGPAAGFEGLEESLPEIHNSGLTVKTKAEVDRKEEARKAARKTAEAPAMDPYGNIAMSDLGLPDIFPGGIPDAKAVELLQRTGAELARLLELGPERGGIDRATYDKRIKEITEPETAAGRASVADKVLKDTPAATTMQQFYQEQKTDAKLPQSLTGEPPAGPPGLEEAGALPEITTPESMFEEQMPAGIAEGPEMIMESTPEQMARIPDDRYRDLNMKLFNKLPPREEIGRVPRSPGRRGRYPYRRGGQKKREIVREE